MAENGEEEKTQKTTYRERWLGGQQNITRPELRDAAKPGVSIAKTSTRLFW